MTTPRNTITPTGTKRSKRHSRFTDRSSLFVWFRLLPCIFIIISIAVLFFFSKGPAPVRTSQYPLDYTEAISQASQEYSVNPYWICATIKAESSWEPDAVSSVGAVGLMQVLPDTADELADLGLVDSSKYPSENLTDPTVNIEYGTAYLRYLVEHYHEMEPAIAAYNAGMGNVDKWMENGGDIRDNIKFPATKAYLLTIVRNKEQYEELYPNAFG